MFGRNDFVENVKSALAAVDCDMGAFRSWQKMYDKLKKKKSEQEDRYRDAESRQSVCRKMHS